MRLDILPSGNARTCLWSYSSKRSSFWLRVLGVPAARPITSFHGNDDSIPKYTSRTLQGTLTVLLSLTKPWNPPARCNIAQELTSIITTDGWNATAILLLLYSNLANPAYSSCQPWHWENVNVPSGHSYSPAIFPSSWYALEVELLRRAWWLRRM